MPVRSSTPHSVRELQLADWIQTLDQSSLREIHAALLRPGVLSLALGMPDPRLFPSAALCRAAVAVLEDDRNALQYELPFEPLKRHVVALMKYRGVCCSEDQVFLTAGAQQGIELLVRLLLDAPRPVLLESVVYDGIQLAVSPFGSRRLVVPTDPETGIDVGAVERLLGTGVRPALMYVIPDGHNPLGARIPMEARAKLMELASRYGVPVIEDDAYGFLQYENALPSIRSLSPEWGFYVGSFSKILAPGLRVGWLVVPARLVPKLSILKQLSDIDVSCFTQRLVARYLDSTDFLEHIAFLRREYAARRNSMIGALREHLPNVARWRRPHAGFFVWAELPHGTDARKFLQFAAATEAVAFVPGDGFSVCGDVYARRCIRLNFSSNPPEHIRAGVIRLGRALRKWVLVRENRTESAPDSIQAPPV
jgi:2-aminoadipate transaminase